MSFHSQYKELQQEGYKNKQIAEFMGISIRSLYYYKKNAYKPKYTKQRMNKTFIRVIRYEKKQAKKQQIKEQKYREKWKKEEVKRQKEYLKKYKEPDFFDEMPKPLEGDYTRKDPVLRGFDSDKIKKTVKKYPPQYEVLYSLMFEFTIVHTGGRRELKREWTAYRRNPDNCITQMQIILESISNSVDVYLTNTEWNYETQLLISGY